MIKLVISSDWHVDHVTSGVSRYDEIERAVMRSVEDACAREVDAYLFLGDLCDADAGMVSYRCVELLLRAALRCYASKIRFIAVAGNHDVLEDGSGETTLTPLRALDLEGIHLFERPGLLSIEDASGEWEFVALPFTASAHPYIPGEEIADLLGDRPTIVAGHLSIPGVIPGEETHEMPRGREVTFPTAEVRANPNVRAMFNGHYHRRQTTADGIHIPGSLARLTFGEQDHTPGYLYAEIGPGRSEVKAVRA